MVLWFSFGFWLRQIQGDELGRFFGDESVSLGSTWESYPHGPTDALGRPKRPKLQNLLGSKNEKIKQEKMPNKPTIATFLIDHGLDLASPFG